MLNNEKLDKAIMNLTSLRGSIGVMRYILNPEGGRLTPLQDDFDAFFYDIQKKLDQALEHLTPG